MGLTPLQAAAQIRAQAGEDSTNFLTDAVLYSFLWQAEIELANFVGCSISKDTSIPTVSGTREYALPTGCMQILRLLYDSVKLKKINLTELDMLEGSAYGGITNSGQPQYYYEIAGSVGLSPIPNAAKTLTFYMVKEPTALSALSTAFTINVEYAHYLIDYCLYRFYAMDGNSNQAKLHLDIWELSKRKCKELFNKKNYRDQYLTVRDEDIFNGTTYGII